MAHVNEEFMEYVPGLLLFRVVKGPREGPISWYWRNGQFPYTPKFSYLKHLYLSGMDILWSWEHGRRLELTNSQEQCSTAEGIWWIITSRGFLTLTGTHVKYTIATSGYDIG